MKARLAVTVFKAALFLLPRELRRRYGREILDVMSRRLAEGATSVAREVAGIAMTSMRARQRAAGWILVTAAVSHTAWAAYLYPKATMGGLAIALTAGMLTAGSALLLRERHAR